MCSGLLDGALNGSLTAMSLPYKISTLIYCFNEAGDVLLIERAKEPNLGCWSPPGGKLEQATGESPAMCACREAQEEMGLDLKPEDLHLTGIVSEVGYQGQAHWLMFLYEVKRPINEVPPPDAEGRFAFFTKDQLSEIQLPPTDGQHIWPLFWEHRGGFFSSHCICGENGSFDWTVEASIKPGELVS